MTFMIDSDGQIEITLPGGAIPDLNKMVSRLLKARGLSVKDAHVFVSGEEPGRCWVKRPGETSVTAYG